MSWDVLLSSPGLSFLATDIFLLLDVRSFSSIELVCRSWQRHVVADGIWKRKLIRSAKRGSYNRHLVEDRSGDLSSASSARCRRLCWQLLAGGLREEWKKKKIRVHRIANAKMIRALAVTDDFVVFAQDSSVHVADRKSGFESSGGDGGSCDLAERCVLSGGHRREISCLDLSDGRLVAGGRDRRLTLWDHRQGRLLDTVENAHTRLITAVRMARDGGSSCVTGSRDRSIKHWAVQDDDDRLVLLQQVLGHSHSVWAVDLSLDFLVSGSSDRAFRVFSRRNNKKTSQEELFEEDFRMEEHTTGVRNVLILACDPGLAVSGDIFGDLRVWNLREKRLQYAVEEVEEEEGGSWFRHCSAVIALSQVVENGLLAAAFGNHRVVLYSTSAVRDRLPVFKAIDLKPFLALGSSELVRSVVATPSEIYVGLFSGKESVVVLDVWNLQPDDGGQAEELLSTQ